jgi:radical SAM superfamily enzyme YgiQ (UPF0313 family)
MKITLVNPRYTDIYGRYETAARKAVLACPPLGVLYVAAVLERNGHKVSIIDAEAELLSNSEIARIIEKNKPQVLGITSTTPTHHKAERLFSLSKKIDKQIITISGGPHPTVLPLETLETCNDIDFVVYGEGEKTIVELIAAVENNEDLSNIKGICFRKGGKIKKTPTRDLISDIDTLPFPARHLLKKDLYKWSVPGHGILPVTSISTTRGCPFSCIFCSQHLTFGKKVRYRTIDRVIEEIRDIISSGVSHLIFVDDSLTLNKNRTIDLCKKLMAEELNITWEGMTRVDLVDKNLLQLMKNAGFVRISYGIESGNPHILNCAKKGITLDQIRKAYEITESIGLEARSSAIFGLPFETQETVRKTIRFLKSVKCKQTYINIGTPFPGTEYYEMAKNGFGGLKLLTNDWREYRRWHNAVIEVNDLTKEDLIAWQRKAMLQFYLRPKQIFYNLKRAGLKAAIQNVSGFLRSFILGN